MDTTLSKQTDHMWYRYFVDFWHSISVFASFSNGVAVLGIPLNAVILLPLRPMSVMHKNPKRHKIIHSMCSIGHKDWSIDLNMCICKNILFE